MLSALSLVWELFVIAGKLLVLLSFLNFVVWFRVLSLAIKASLSPDLELFRISDDRIFDMMSFL